MKEWIGIFYLVFSTGMTIALIEIKAGFWACVLPFGWLGYRYVMWLVQ